MTGRELAGVVTLLTAGALLCGGCNVDKLAGSVDRMDGAAAGARHARGGVNYEGPGAAKDGWDRQISSCRADGSGGLTFAGGGRDLLQVSALSGAVTGVVVHGPSGDASFAVASCSTRKLNTRAAADAPRADAAGALDGTVTLDCAEGGRELRAAVDFAGCGR